MTDSGQRGIPERKLIVRVDGAGSDGGRGVVLAYRVGTGIEIVATEARNGDASVTIDEESAVELLRAVAAALQLTSL